LSKLVADAAQRARALDPCESFIVQAPAGSGKTELLIQRFLSLLAEVEHPESILAITFTIKATGEMRDRVLNALHDASQPAPAEEHRRQTWNLARAALARDAELGWQLLENPSRLRIQTMDALCASIVRQMPWLSRFGGMPAFEEKAEPYYREAARATLGLLETSDPASGHVENLLRHLDNDFSKVETLLITMLGRRDQWLRTVVGQRHVSDGRQQMEQIFQRVIREALQRTRESLPESQAAALARWLQMEELPATTPDYLFAWVMLRDKLLTKEGALRKRGVLDNPALGLQPEDPFVARLAELACLPDPQFEDAQWVVLEALLELLPIAAAQLRLVFQRRNLIDFQELSSAARQALGTAAEPTLLAFSLDYRLQHILVDEFQDTSYAQYGLISALTADWQPEDGRTLFAVGDPMQSVYLFRDAEVGLFLRARQEGFGQVPLTPLRLEVNFRSEGGLVDWINRAFPSAFSEKEDPLTGAVAYAPLKAFHPPGESRAVVVHPFFEGRSLDEARRIVELVNEARRRDPQGTVAILVRARTHLTEALPLLRQAGLRFRAVEIDDLGDRPVVQDLLALTRALLHLADRSSWLAILRAPWCGLTLADLHALAAEDAVATVWELLQEDGRLAAMTLDGRQRATMVRNVLERALAEQGRLPLRRWVESTWAALGGPACLEEGASAEDASTFLNLLESAAVADQLEDLSAFEAKVSDLFGRPDVEAGDKLHVMTIHKAKGLEFDTVIVPALGMQPKREDPSLLLHLERPGPHGQAELLMAPIYGTGAKADRIYSYLDSVQKEKREHEMTRLLYVAATRARKQLHLLGAVKVKQGGEMSEPPKHSLLRRIWHVAERDFAAALAQCAGPPPQTDARLPGVLLRRLPAGRQLPKAPEDVAWQPAGSAAGGPPPDEQRVTYEWVSGMQRHVGTVVHAFLQRLARDPGLQWEQGAVRARLAAEGVPPADLEEAARRVEAAIASTLADERGNWILSGHQEAYTEYPVSGLVEGEPCHFIIDRTFVDAQGVRWIIDYKTSTHEGGGIDAFLDNERERYHEQLERYAALVRRADDRAIRLGLYFPLLQGWREWSFGEQRSLGFDEQ
jgi:ATP-dependent helicase/nuclease subunit A